MSYQEEYQEEEIKTTEKPMFNITFLGFCFMIHFSGFYISQNLQSEINEVSGLLGLSILNLMAALCTFFIAPGLVEKLGEKKSMMFSALGYAVFVYMSGPKASLSTLAFTGLIAGFCQGLFWVGCFVYITASSTEIDRQKLLSHFSLLYSGSHFFANLITALIQVKAGDYYQKPSEDWLALKEDNPNIEGGFDFSWTFTISAIVIAGNALVFLFLKEFIRPQGVEHNAKEFSSSEAFALMKNGLVNLYIPMAFAGAFSMTIVYADLPNYINDTLFSAWSLAAFGGTHIVWGYFARMLSPKMGDSMLFIISGIAIPVVITFSSFARDSKWYFFGAAIAMGTVDSSITSQLNHIFTRDFSDRLPACLSLTLGFTFIGLMLGFFVSSFSNFKEKIILTCVIHFAAVALAIVQGIRKQRLRTDNIDDEDVTLGNYSSDAVLAAVKESQEKSEYEFDLDEEKPKTKGKGKGKGKKSEYDEFGANY